MAETILMQKRKEKNLSQSALAEITGINRSIIGRAENREFMPSVEQLQTLGEVYFIKTNKIKITGKPLFAFQQSIYQDPGDLLKLTNTDFLKINM